MEIMVTETCGAEVLSSRAAAIEALRQALADRAAEIEAERQPSGRELAMALVDEISLHLKDRMPWSAIFRVFRERGVKISPATLKGYYRQAQRQRRGGVGVARSGRRGDAAGQQGERLGGAVQAPVMAPVGPPNPVSGHGRIMSEEC